MTPTPEPRQAIKLKWCPVCGRDNQMGFLAERRHKPGCGYGGERLKGGFCPGELVELVYALKTGHGS